jgi:transcriptional antiterminator NusG
MGEPDSTTSSAATPEALPPSPHLGSAPSGDSAPAAAPGAPLPPPDQAAVAANEVVPLTTEPAGQSPGAAPVANQPPPAQEHAEAPEEEAPEEEAPEEEAPEEEAPEEEVPEEPEIDLSQVKPLEFIDETVADEDLKFDWFILKVQVNREDSIKDTLWRRIKMNGLERFFKEIVVPTEDVVEFTKTGKKRVVKRKLYPGYVLINMAVNDESWFIVRETTGIGDFTGSAGKPTPMEPKDVERILRSSKVLPEEEGAGVKTTIPFKNGDRVRVKEGYFQNFEGEVHAIDQAHGRVTVMINIFGRATPVEIEHWQIEAV